jgi:DNA-binding NtrC family response regulator
VRVIAAANKSIEDLIVQEKFRQDLYFRLNVYEIQPKPLREHPEDIPDLVQFFLANLVGPRFSIAEDALKYLCRQSWPGNIRELKNAIERAIILAKRRNSTTLEKSDVVSRSAGLSSTRAPQSMIPKTFADVSPDSYQEFLRNSEREYIRAVLSLSNFNSADAASRLGIGRSTLFRKMAELGLNQKSAEVTPGLKTSTDQEREYVTPGEAT